MISYMIAKITYLITWIPWYLLFRIFLNYKVVYTNPSIDIKKSRGPLIIAAQHSSWLDPFFIVGIFPPFSPAFPIRFATHYAFFRYIHTALFVRMYGSFPVKRKIGLEKILKPPVEFLMRGQIIGIFPEGRKRHLGRPRKGRRGVAYLAIRTHSPVLPCHIKGNMYLTAKTFFLRKNQITVYVGSPFFLPKELNTPNNIQHLNKATEIVMEKIYELKDYGMM